MNIRVWNSKTRQELLRIQVPNLECYCCAFTSNGKHLSSGWSDGKIRVFLPVSGKLAYVISDAHNHGCTSIAVTHDNKRIISGGIEGEVRVWQIQMTSQTMVASLKEHRGRVNSVIVSGDDDYAVSASNDGSTIVWDLKTFTRVICLFDPTMFKQVV